MEGSAEAAAVVQMQREGGVAERPKRLVVMPVHVAREEIKHGHVRQVQHSPTRVIRRDVAHQRAVLVICNINRMR